MLVWQAWLGTTTLFWPPSPLLGVTSVLITIPFVFSSCYFCFQAQAGWLQHDFGHLSVFKKSKWDHFFHYLTIGAIKVTTVVVPAPVFLWLPSACGFFSSLFFFLFFFPALFFFLHPAQTNIHWFGRISRRPTFSMCVYVCIYVCGKMHLKRPVFVIFLT